MTLSVHDYASLSGEPLRYGVLSPPENIIDVTQGRRKPMVFFPGLGGSVKNALVFFNAMLPTAAPIYVPDLRGFGLNEHFDLPHPAHFVNEARHFLNSVVLGHHSDTPLIIGGISLGAALATRLFEWPEVNTHTHRLLLVAPAFRENPAMFPLPLVMQTAAKVMLEGALAPVKLPYGLEALTRNPQVLADPKHQEHTDNFRLPAQFMWRLRQFNRHAAKQIKHVNVPTCMVIPGQERVVDPFAMESAFQQLSNNPSRSGATHHRLYYPEAFHDVFIEPEVLTIARDVSHWLYPDLVSVN